MLVWLGRRTVPMVGSVHAVVWQACTNWAGPVRIQIYYGDRVTLRYVLTMVVLGGKLFIKMLKGTFICCMNSKE